MEPSTAKTLTDIYAQIVPARCDWRADGAKVVRRNFAPIVEPYLAGEDEVLDLGCGLGGYSFLVEELGGRPTGIDCSERAIEIATRIARELGSAARFVIGDYTALPFQAESYDVVIFPKNIVECSYEEMERVAAETNRVLRRGGTFVLTMRDALKLLAVKGASAESPWELRTGRQHGSVSIPEFGSYDYPTYFWTVGFAAHVVGRHLSVVKIETIEEGEVLVFRKATVRARTRQLEEPTKP